MFRIIIFFVVIAVAIGGFLYWQETRPPLYDLNDFRNEEPAEEPAIDEERAQRREFIATQWEGKENVDPYKVAIDLMRDYTQSNFFEDALRVSAEIETTMSPDAEYYELKGDLALKRRQYRNAAEAYGKALELDQFRTSTYLRLAELYLRNSEQREKALALYARARRVAGNRELKTEIRDRIEQVKEIIGQ